MHNYVYKTVPWAVSMTRWLTIYLTYVCEVLGSAPNTINKTTHASHTNPNKKQWQTPYSRWLIIYFIFK